MRGTRLHRWAAPLLALLLLPIGYAAVPAQPADAAPVRCSSAPYGLNRYGPGSGRTVALTFDDGPGRDTKRIMSILAAKHVTATFFNLGSLEAANPAIVRAQQAAGYALGAHTWGHVSMPNLGAAAQAAELDRARSGHAAITGYYPCLFRPPYGNYDQTTLRLAAQRGMRVWNWSVDTEDWKAGGWFSPFSSERIVYRAEAGTSLAHPVILFHNQPGGNPATVAALPAIIDYYRARGYVFVDLLGNTGLPTVRTVGPTSGATAGGARVTVTGTNLRAVRAVLFGRVAGTRLHLVSPTKLLVTAPKHAAGRVDVRVVTDHGTSPVRSSDRYTYVAPPTITSLSPNSGPTSGGTRVSVTGSDLTRVIAVTFGSQPGTQLHLVSSTQLLVTAPAGTEGVVRVQVRTAYGTSPDRTVDDYSYVAPAPPPVPPAPPEPPVPPVPGSS